MIQQWLGVYIGPLIWIQMDLVNLDWYFMWILKILKNYWILKKKIKIQIAHH